MTEIILYKSPIKALKLIALSSIFVLPSIYFLLPENNPKLVVWICACFFSLGYIVGFINLFDRRPQIIINSKGIFDRRFKFEIILWDDITSAYLYNIRGSQQFFISLALNPKISDKIKTPKWVGNFNHFLGVQKANINVSDIKVNKDKLLSAIKQLSAEQPENRNTAISKLNLK